MKTREKIIALIRKHGSMTVHDMSQVLGVSRQYMHRMINELLDQNMIQVFGKPPHVFYSLHEESHVQSNDRVDFEQEQFLKQHFILVDPLGNLLEGLQAFKYWCEKQDLKTGKTLAEYIITRGKYLAFYNHQHLIDGTEKLKSTKGIGQIGVDSLFFLDFYAIERFGKTRLGTLMHYAKQGQNKRLK